MLTPAPVPSIAQKYKGLKPGVELPSEISELLERSQQNDNRIDIKALAEIIQNEYKEFKMELADAK